MFIGWLQKVRRLQGGVGSLQTKNVRFTRCSLLWSTAKPSDAAGSCQTSFQATLQPFSRSGRWYSYLEVSSFSIVQIAEPRHSHTANIQVRRTILSSASTIDVRQVGKNLDRYPLALLKWPVSHGSSWSSNTSVYIFLLIFIAFSTKMGNLLQAPKRLRVKRSRRRVARRPNWLISFLQALAYTL